MRLHSSVNHINHIPHMEVFLEDFHVLTIKVMGLQPVATKAAITHMRKRCQQEPEASWLQNGATPNDETTIAWFFVPVGPG